MKETAGDKRESSRLKDHQQRRVLDAASRKRRQRKALDALEQDNYHDDPHANLVMHKKAPKFEESLHDGGGSGGGGGGGSGGGGSGETKAAAAANLKRKRARNELFKQRFRKNFAALLEEEQLSCATSEETSTYFTAAAPPSKFSERKFCAVCGFPSNYTCGTCGSRYCSVKCLGTHRDTRCLKWTA